MPHGDPRVLRPGQTWTPTADAVAGKVVTTLVSTEGQPALPLFNQWHFLRDLPDAYQKDVRTKVNAFHEAFDTHRARTENDLPSLQALFVRQGNFTLCVLRSLAGSGPADVDPVAYGMAKRNMRVASRPGKRPERESAQAGQRAALGRAIDAWMRGKLAWTRPRTARG